MSRLKLREINSSVEVKSVKPRYSIKSWSRNTAIAIVAVIGFMTTGFGATATPQAVALTNPLDKICGYDSPNEHPGGITEWPGLVGGFVGASDNSGWTTSSSAPTGKTSSSLENPISFGNIDNTKKPYMGNRAVTAYEWWGTAANQWIMTNIPNDKSFDGTCLPAAKSAGNVAANAFWGIDKMIAGLGLAIFSFSMGIDAFDPFLGIVKCVISGCERVQGDATRGSGGLVDGLFLEYLIPIVMLGALWMGWKGVIKRSGTEAVQGAVWMVLAAGASIAFMVNASWWAGSLNTGINKVSSSLMSTISGSISPGEGSLCYLPEDAPDRGTRIAACSVWETFVYTPWASGQFGSLIARPLPPDLKAVPGSISVQVPGQSKTQNMVAVHIDAFTFNHDEVVAMAAGTKPDKFLENKKKQFVALVDALADEPAAAEWAGNKWGDRFFISLVALIAMLVGAVPIMALSFSLIVLQFGMIMLLLTAPLFFIIGIHPGFGRRIAISWVEMILGLTIKRVITVVLISLLMAIMQAVMLAKAGFIPTTIMLGAVGIGMMQYRKKILEQTSQISLGGSGNMLSGAGQGKKLGNMISSGFAQGVGSKRAGGSFLTGLGAGVLAGRSGGTPLTSYRGGREAAERKQNKDANIAAMANQQRLQELNQLHPMEIQKREAAQLKTFRDQDRLMRGPSGQAGNAAQWAAWYERDGVAAPIPINSALAKELHGAGVPMRLPNLAEDPQYMADLHDAGYTPEMISFMTGNPADGAVFSDYLSGRIQPPDPAVAESYQQLDLFDDNDGGGPTPPWNPPPSTPPSSGGGGGAGGPRVPTGGMPGRPPQSIVLPQPGTPEYSAYWSDKPYGFEAPDGTVHPDRQADRVAEQLRLQREDLTTDMLLDPSGGHSTPLLNTEPTPREQARGVGYSERHRNLVNNTRRHAGLPELSLKDFIHYSQNQPGRRLTDPSVMPLQWPDE